MSVKQVHVKKMRIASIHMAHMTAIVTLDIGTVQFYSNVYYWKVETERTIKKTRKWRLCWCQRMYGQSLYEKCALSQHTWIISVSMQRKVIQKWNPENLNPPKSWISLRVWGTIWSLFYMKIRHFEIIYKSWTISYIDSTTLVLNSEDHTYLRRITLCCCRTKLSWWTMGLTQ